MKAYRLQNENGRRIVHLRWNADRSGTLFIDAVDAVRLNASGMLLAYLALEGIPRRAANIFHKIQCGDTSPENESHRENLQRWLDRLIGLKNACPTDCGKNMDRVPAFSITPSAPYKADFALTYACNNSCSHCYNEASRKQCGATSLNLAQEKRILLRLAEIGVPHVIFTGGEPTLSPHLPDLIAEANRLNLVTGLNTNGRRLADLAFAEKLFNAGLSHVQVTLESDDSQIHNEMTGADSFVETCQGIENAATVGLHVLTNSTLTRRNAERIDRLPKFLFELGVRTFAVNHMIASGSGVDHSDSLDVYELPNVLAKLDAEAKRLKMRWLWYSPTRYCEFSPIAAQLPAKRCNAGEYSICVEPNGDVLPCQSMYVTTGNILNDDWRSIWNGSVFERLRNRTTDPLSAGLPPGCFECPDLQLCGGGCMLEIFRQPRLAHFSHLSERE